MNDCYPPIGILRTCFAEKFGVPRQSLMMTEARGILKLNPDPLYPQALMHLDQFSHLWLVFQFHKNADRAWRPMIDPPRVEAGMKVGVFASRSPHRPNPIGLSAVKLDRIDLDAKGGIEIHVSGVDILDETPILDIKPYLPFTDRIPDANDGWATGEIRRYEVEFSEAALKVIQSATDKHHPRLKELIEQMLEFDPRPTSQRRAQPIHDPASEGLRFAFRVMDLDVHWQIRQGAVWVVEVRICAR